VDVRFEVAGNRREFFVGGDLIFGALTVAQDALRRFLVAPEFRLGDARFEAFQAFAMLRSVKDSSAPARCAA
jgi:hypothetical protein